MACVNCEGHLAGNKKKTAARLFHCCFLSFLVCFPLAFEHFQYLLFILKPLLCCHCLLPAAIRLAED
jgi:hypothetical protein